MIVPLDQHDIGARTRRSNCGGSTGRPSAGNQRVAFTKKRYRARKLGDRSGGPRASFSQPTGAEHLGLKEQAAIVGGICGHEN